MSKPPVSKEQKTTPHTWGWTAALYLLMTLLLLSLLTGLEKLPWAGRLALWTLPATMAAGVAVYLLSLVMLALPQPTSSANSGLTVNRSEVLWQLALLGLAGLLGALLAAQSATVATPEL